MARTGRNKSDNEALNDIAYNTAGGSITVTENLSQVGGTSIDTNSGVKSAGTQRIVIATDQPQLTNAFKVDGSAVAQPVSTKQLTSAPSNFAVATADGTVFTLASGEVGFIQNLDSADALAVKRGAGASTSSLSFILACGSAQDDGKGGSVLIDDFVGAVSVATMTGVGRYIAWKEAP